VSGVAIKINMRDKATAPLLRVQGALQRGDVRKVMGRSVANDLRAYFLELDHERPNELGGKRTHFWSDVRRSVQQPKLVGTDAVEVSINQVGFAQRLFGGRIVPRNARWLAIPARAEAYGKRAREFNDLHFVLFRPDLAALVQNEQVSLGGRVHGSVTEKRRKGEAVGGGIFYWLRASVTQQPDPTVLPKNDDLAKNAATEADAYLQTLADRAEGAN
jgi:hypothetical protein